MIIQPPIGALLPFAPDPDWVNRAIDNVGQTRRLSLIDASTGGYVEVLSLSGHFALFCLKIEVMNNNGDRKVRLTVDGEEIFDETFLSGVLPSSNIAVVGDDGDPEKCVPREIQSSLSLEIDASGATADNALTIEYCAVPLP